MAAKLAEAEEHLRKAEKAMKTSFFKRTPDFDMAGDEYSRAATNFKIAGDKARMLDALDKASECYMQMRSLFQAGRMLEQAVTTSKDLGQLDMVAEYASRGALIFRQDGSTEAAAQLLEKAAKILELKAPDKAADLYDKAFETVGVEDRPREAAEYLAKAAKLHVGGKNFDAAVGIIRRCLAVEVQLGGAQAGRSAAGLVMVELMRDDSVAASKAFNEFGAYCDCDTSSALKAVLAAFEEEDREAAESALKGAGILNLDVEYARLAKQIPLPDADGIEAAAARLGQARIAAAGDADKADEKPKAANDDDDLL